MNHHQQNLIINATPAAVYAALTTPAGLSGWWTEDCDVPTEVGSTIHFRFGPHYKDMRIEHLEPSREVRWYCTRAHIAVGNLTRSDEWVGTEIVFRLMPDGEGRTRVHFEHIGLV
ncbi:MAG TPA: SRPBCC domain-containing protein, partial [Rhodanobacteraceae bacterium]|nr:SRPBCC domain-containing protein [Rhodanobacteraceae bacterium]